MRAALPLLVFVSAAVSAAAAVASTPSAALRGLRRTVTTPSPTAAASPVSALQAPVSPAPSWHSQDGVCVDNPYQWRDTRGDSCQEYVAKKFCTSDGGYGQGWWQTWGTFATFASQGQSAQTACCGCGGGQLSCCKSYHELETHIRATMFPYRGYVDQLKSWIRKQVAAHGELEEKRLNKSLAAWHVALEATLVNASSTQREKALALEKERFDELANHSGSLREAVEHEIIVAVNAAARGAVSEGSARIDGGRMMKQAYGVLQHFRNAALAWESTRNRTRDVAKRGEDAWAEYYADPNATWKSIRLSIDHANRFANGAAKARQAVRRSKQAARVATDLSEITRNYSDILEEQVRMAQDRAQRALRATQANSGKLDILEAMIREADTILWRICTPTWITWRLILTGSPPRALVRVEKGVI